MDCLEMVICSIAYSRISLSIMKRELNLKAFACDERALDDLNDDAHKTGTEA